MKINSKATVTVKISQEINRGLKAIGNNSIKYNNKRRHGTRESIFSHIPTNDFIKIDGIKVF